MSSCYFCLAVVSIDFALKIDENYYWQVFSEECKYIEKENEVTRYRADDIAICSDDSDESDEE